VFPICDEERQQKIAVRTPTDMQRSPEPLTLFKEHAWKSTSVARADAHQIPRTHFRFDDFRNIDVR